LDVFVLAAVSALGITIVKNCRTFYQILPIFYWLCNVSDILGTCFSTVTGMSGG